MNDLKNVDTNTCVTLQGQYAVVNEGSGYAIINTQTQQVMVRNISSFLDCVKTLEYIFDNTEFQNPSETSDISLKKNISLELIQEGIKVETKEIDELDLALIRSLVSYFERMRQIIYKYYKDHQASFEEMQVITKYYLKAAETLKHVKTQQDLEEMIKSLESLKQKISRYKHENHKYCWSVNLEEEILVKLRKIMDTLKH